MGNACTNIHTQAHNTWQSHADIELILNEGEVTRTQKNIECMGSRVSDQE